MIGSRQIPLGESWERPWPAGNHAAAFYCLCKQNNDSYAETGSAVQPKNEKVNQEVFELMARGLRGPGGCQSDAGVGGGHSGCLIHAAWTVLCDFFIYFFGKGIHDNLEEGFCVRDSV